MTGCLTKIGSSLWRGAGMIDTLLCSGVFNGVIAQNSQTDAAYEFSSVTSPGENATGPRDGRKNVELVCIGDKLLKELTFHC